MLLKLGNIELQVNLVNSKKSIEDITLSDLKGAVVSIYAPLLDSNIQAVANSDSNQEEEEREEEDILATRAAKRRLEEAVVSQDKAIHFISLLKSAGFTNHTIVMVLKKVLNIHTKQGKLVEEFNTYFQQVLQWENRRLDERTYWGIMIAPVKIRYLGRQSYMAIGINEWNQTCVLGVNNQSVGGLYRDLVSRGLKTKQIIFGMLSLHTSNPQEFKKVFPEAELARDWHEVIEMQDDEEVKEELKQAMVTPDPDYVGKVIEKYKLPKELMTYFNLEPKLWRSLRFAGPIERAARDLRMRLNSGHPKTPEEVRFLFNMSLIRLQYYWIKMPLDSDVADHLKYNKLYVEAIE